MAKPNLATALQEVAQAGVERVIVAPYFLTSGMHLRRDLPALVERERAAHPEIDFAVAEPLEGHSLLVDLLLDRIRTVSDKGGVSA